MEDVKLMIAQADLASENGKKVANASLVGLFRALRKSKIERPDIIVKYGDQVLQSRAVGGIEVWSLYEQIYIAALQFGDIELVDKCSKELNKQFPASLRVMRLLGMQYEYNAEYKKALELYDSLLQQNPSNLLILKRKVCAYKSMGDLKAAAEEIHKILKIIYNDVSLWLELADIHLTLGDYQAASYCLEEVVVLEPHNSAYNTKLADLYYSLGTQENFLRGRKHYVMSLNQQCPRLNLRALYGLIASTKRLEDDGLSTIGVQGGISMSSQEKAVNKELLTWGREQLQAILSGSGVRESARSLLQSALDVL